MLVEAGPSAELVRNPAVDLHKIEFVWFTSTAPDCFCWLRDKIGPMH